MSHMTNSQCVWVCVCTHMFSCVSVCVCVCACYCASMCVCVCTRAHVPVYMCLCVHVYVCNSPSWSVSFSPKLVSLDLSSAAGTCPRLCLSIILIASVISAVGSSCCCCRCIMIRNVEKSSSPFLSVQRGHHHSNTGKGDIGRSQLACAEHILVLTGLLTIESHSLNLFPLSDSEFLIKIKKS